MLAPTLVLGDLHLTRATAPAVGRDLDRVLAEHAGANVIVAGDLFDWAIDLPHAGRARAVTEVLAAQPTVRAALGRHLDRGGELCFVPGNHDPDLAEPELRDAMLAGLGVAPAARARLRTTRWFVRDRTLHVEHGHAYDPDNAPAHPLVVGTRSLGTHFCVEFMHPTGAFDYLTTNDSTPGKLLWAAFARYGWRGPHVVYRYFYAALGALARSGPWYRGGLERELGRREQAAFAESVGLAPPVVDALAELAATPTLASLPATFARLYLDRVVATLALAGGLGAVGLGRWRAGAWCAAAGAALMLLSWQTGHDRYRDGVVGRLAAAAERVADVTGAELVVFGHTHREEVGPRYANTGSFAHPRPPAPAGRPYLAIDFDAGRPRAVRRRVLPG